MVTSYIKAKITAPTKKNQQFKKSYQDVKLKFKRYG